MGNCWRLNTALCNRNAATVAMAEAVGNWMPEILPRYTTAQLSLLLKIRGGVEKIYFSESCTALLKQWCNHISWAAYCLLASLFRVVCSPCLANRRDASKMAYWPWSIVSLLLEVSLQKGYVAPILSSTISTWENNDPRSDSCTNASTGQNASNTNSTMARPEEPTIWS